MEKPTKKTMILVRRVFFLLMTAGIPRLMANRIVSFLLIHCEDYQHDIKTKEDKRSIFARK